MCNTVQLSNLERNSYVREQIETATMHLLAERELREISVSQVTEAAGVSRVSFYRNYEDKEDVVKTYIGRLILGWHKENADRFVAAKAETGKDDVMFESLFGFLKDHVDLFTLLEKRGMFYLFKDALLGIYGPKPEYPNGVAYVSAFAFHGICGWIEEWVRRGMRESGREMVALLAQMGSLG